MDSSFAIAIAVGLAVAGVVGGIAYATFKKKYATLEKAARVEADRVLAEATKAAEAKRREASIEAKEKVLAASAEFEKTVTARRQEIQLLEKRVLQKEENLDRKLATQERREEEYARKEKGVAETQKRADEARQRESNDRPGLIPRGRNVDAIRDREPEALRAERERVA